VLTEVGELEKLGAPVAVDEAMGTSAAAASVTATGVQQPATNLYAQGQQVQQQQQQAQKQKPSQYATFLSCY
jgi:hypothetical protein